MSQRFVTLRSGNEGVFVLADILRCGDPSCLFLLVSEDGSSVQAWDYEINWNKEAPSWSGLSLPVIVDEDLFLLRPYQIASVLNEEVFPIRSGGSCLLVDRSRYERHRKGEEARKNQLQVQRDRRRQAEVLDQEEISSGRRAENEMFESYFSVRVEKAKRVL